MKMWTCTYGVHVLQRHERCGARGAARGGGVVALREELLPHGPQLGRERAHVLLVRARRVGQARAGPRQLRLQRAHLHALLLLVHGDLLRVQLFLETRTSSALVHFCGLMLGTKQRATGHAYIHKYIQIYYLRIGF